MADAGMLGPVNYLENFEFDLIGLSSKSNFEDQKSIESQESIERSKIECDEIDGKLTIKDQESIERSNIENKELFEKFGIVGITPFGAADMLKKNPNDNSATAKAIKKAIDTSSEIRRIIYNSQSRSI